MTIAAGTATVTELNTLHNACVNLSIMLRQVVDGSGKADGTNARFTPAQMDAAVTAVSAAITAANA